jgi:hypothetical protein
MTAPSVYVSHALAAPLGQRTVSRPLSAQGSVVQETTARLAAAPTPAQCAPLARTALWVSRPRCHVPPGPTAIPRDCALGPATACALLASFAKVCVSLVHQHGERVVFSELKATLAPPFSQVRSLLCLFHYCADGTVQPALCGSPAVFCPMGSRAPLRVQEGFFSTSDGSGVHSLNTSTMSQQLPCRPGHFCIAGVEYACPAGTFLDHGRATNVSQCLGCPPGAYCTPACSTPQPCGAATLYCPANASMPLIAGPGYYTSGIEGARSVRLVCPVGRYCPGDGSAHDCPKGTYGSSMGQTSASCDGVCADGALCGPRSTSVDGLPCPAGFTCTRGLPTPCPAGRFGTTVGASDPSRACVACPAGTFSQATGLSSEALCTQCDPGEGSRPGALACWPGVIGEEGCHVFCMWGGGRGMGWGWGGA